jgi:hypothetical protein
LSAERRRAAVHHLMTVMQVSERFACRVTGQHRATQRHRMRGQTRADPDAALRAWLRRWPRDHPRWGFRRAYHSARAEGWIVNHKKVQRLWREEGLRVPQRRDEPQRQFEVAVFPAPPERGAQVVDLGFGPLREPLVPGLGCRCQPLRGGGVMVAVAGAYQGGLAGFAELLESRAYWRTVSSSR